MSLVDSEEDFSFSSEEEEDDDVKLATKKRKLSVKETSATKKQVPISDKKKQIVSTSSAPTNKPSSSSSSSHLKPVVSSSSSGMAPPVAPMQTGKESSISAGVDEDITRGADIHTEAAAKALIMKYMMKENRPYSAIQIFDNLHHRIQKSTLEKCLNILTETYTVTPTGVKQRLLCKEYGKAKIYYPDQNSFETMSSKELDDLNAEIDRLTKEADQAQKRNKDILSRIAALSAEPSDDDIDREIGIIEQRVEAKRQQIAQIKSAGPVDPRAMEKAVKEFNATRALWRDRKIACIEALEVIAEGMNKKLKVVMGDMGVDGDDDVGVTLPAAIPEVKK